MKQRLLWLLLLSAAGCKCNAGGLITAQPEIRTDLLIDLGDVYVGQTKTVPVEIANAGTAGTTVTLSLEPPFELDQTELTLGPGASATVTISFTALAPGPVTRQLELKDWQSSAVVARGVEVPMCSAPAACDETRFDFTLGTCVTTPRPENSACEDACVIGGSCLAGVCTGAFRSCEDSNACTIESCSLTEGCRHTPRDCPAPTNPCQVATCDAATGCGVQNVDDGTLCGPDECRSMQVAVCLQGACVMRPRPPSAQCTNTWVAMEVPARVGHMMAFDAARNRTIMFGGRSDETWEYDGAAWSQRFPVGRPSARDSGAMTWDSFRRRAVLFGGQNSNGALGDTWEWDGTTWTEKHPVRSPPASWGQVMAYDAARQRSVLFSLGQTWEWDGASWTERTPATAPSSRSWPVMAYDPVRQRVVLFGGRSLTAFETDTWEWDGTSWSRRSTALAPRASSGAAMSWDGLNQRMILFGGYRNLGTPEYFDELWQWDGTGWAQVAVATPGPTPRHDAVAVWDSLRARMVMFGGSSPTSTALAETWEWDGAQWQATAVVSAPGQRTIAALTYDAARSRLVLFGGLTPTSRLADTWEWDGLRWAERRPLVKPAERMAHALGFDRARQRVVLFGGAGVGGNLFDTWTFDGSAWSSLSPASPPSGAAVGIFSWDPVNQRLLLARHRSPGGVIELWSFDGAEWTNTMTAWPGMSCTSGSSAFDVVRSRLVLFCDSAAQTWEYDGTSWTQMNPSRSPTPRGISSMTWNSATQRITLFGLGTSAFSEPGETWEYDGAQWTQLLPGASPSGIVSRSSLNYDEARQRLTLFNGTGIYVYLP